MDQGKTEKALSDKNGLNQKNLNRVQRFRIEKGRGMLKMDFGSSQHVLINKPEAY